MILITISLSLAACGGSSGSKGDTGATGADGSIAVPTATANSIAFGGTELDLDYSLTGYDPGSTIVVKVDNVTDAGDRTRYYMYWGTGESTKKTSWMLSTHTFLQILNMLKHAKN